MHMNRMMVKFLRSRGLTLDEVRSYSDDTCPVLPHTDEMCAILKGIHDRGEGIVILPDFDTDGVMSGVIGHAGLGVLGFNQALFLPDPRRGYEARPEDVDAILSQFPYVKWIITCDVGITCFDMTAHAKSLGLGVLITDHHTLAADGALPEADCIVDPYLDNPGDIHVSVCGAFVLQRVLARYAELYGSAQDAEDIDRLRLFAGLGTIGDMMDVRWENRALLNDSYSCARLYWEPRQPLKDDHGNIMPAPEPSKMLSMLTDCEYYRRAFLGFSELLTDEEGLGKLRSQSDISGNLYGWYLSPLINASKRMVTDREYDVHPMSDAFMMFFGNEKDRKTARAKVFASNDARKDLVDEILDHTLSSSDNIHAPYCYVVDCKGHHNILGLVANKLIQVNHNATPVYVCASHDDGSFSGSFRCPGSYDGLSRVRAFGCGVVANGHPQAFGCSVPDEATLVSLIDWIKADAAAYAPSEEDAAKLPWDILASEDGRGDVGIELNVFEEFLADCENFKPFGQGFPAPVVAVRFDLDECGGWKAFSGGKHYKAVLPYGFNVLFWHGEEKVGNLSGEVYVVGELQVSEFNTGFSIVRNMQLVGDFIAPAETYDALVDAERKREEEERKRLLEQR